MAVVIEDDPDIRDLIITVFQQSGFTVHAAVDGVSGVEQVRQHTPTVVTLDLGLPDIDGFEVTRRIRLDSDCYIIMLSARTDEAEALMGLGAGADDFITKPFRPRELRARIAAMLRRPRGPAHVPNAEEVRHEPEATAETTDSAADGALPPPSAARLEHNGLTVDPQTRLVWLNRRQVELTRTEFDLLLTLMRSGRRVRTKTDLVRHLRADHLDAQTYVSDADERAVEVHIGNLRKKLGQSGQVPAWIETVRGVGYRMSVVHAVSP
ncbi:response regulator transcription factor [Nesterenkonia muleiensis]|uniref:response regulator transcription factor n=1 Tax=Nesterenkonia muleiensis TaxID=2282648 RepID=UPI000E707925|nr:response regulator transcription factor [Nesterenkonia muleiensis]